MLYHKLDAYLRGPLTNYPDFRTLILSFPFSPGCAFDSLMGYFCETAA